MYLINKESNRIQNHLQEKTFSELGFKERKHLQEWISESPEILGEPLLVIQKEFDGFDGTNERLDLLALDKNGNIVVIENKLDDTGRDVIWQALKYAGYCSTLTKEQIRSIYQDYLNKRGNGENATEKLADFYNEKEYEELALNQGQTQRVMLIAGNFRKEVTSTVLWLLNYRLKIQCFKASVFALDDRLILDVEQIIPTKDTAEYVISMADKAQEEQSTKDKLRNAETIRLEFWARLLPLLKGKLDFFQNTNPTKDHWLSSGGTGISSVHYSFIITKEYVGVELAIKKSSQEANKAFFDELKKSKKAIEESFGDELSWERLEGKKMCRVAYNLPDVSIFNKDDWDKILDFLPQNMIKFEKALREPLLKAKKALKEQEED